jgi:AcrR family transcriptional regulator
MSQTPTENTSLADKRRVGRPPSERARQAILDTAYRILMNEGLGRMTVERVASEAGVGKPTIYRSWNNAQELAMAAFMAHPESEQAKYPKGSARAAIIAHLSSVITAFASNRGRQITLTMASADPESELAKAFRNQVIMKSRETGRNLINLGIQSDSLKVNTDIDAVLDMLYGPVFFRLLAGHLALTADFATQLVDTIFDGIARRD